MNILFLEDRGSVSFYISEYLEQKEHTVIRAFSILEANSCLRDYSINLLILDLNLSPDGLTDEEIIKTKDGIITGWIWFRNYVKNAYPQLKNSVIILSEYLNVLDTYYKEETKNVIKIAKRGFPSPIRQLAEKIDELN